jgi:hypothetical protein
VVKELANKSLTISSHALCALQYCGRQLWHRNSSLQPDTAVRRSSQGTHRRIQREAAATAAAEAAADSYNLEVAAAAAAAAVGSQDTHCRIQGEAAAAAAASGRTLRYGSSDSSSSNSNCGRTKGMAAAGATTADAGRGQRESYAAAAASHTSASASSDAARHLCALPPTDPTCHVRILALHLVEISKNISHLYCSAACIWLQALNDSLALFVCYVFGNALRRALLMLSFVATHANWLLL